MDWISCSLSEPTIPQFHLFSKVFLITTVAHVRLFSQIGYNNLSRDCITLLPTCTSTAWASISSVSDLPGGQSSRRAPACSAPASASLWNALRCEKEQQLALHAFEQHFLRKKSRLLALASSKQIQLWDRTIQVSKDSRKSIALM